MESKTSPASGFLYGVVNEASQIRSLKRRMNSLCNVLPATGPALWKPPTHDEQINAIGDVSRMTAGFREVLNGRSDMFSQCPAPWDDEFLALHGTEPGEEGQTYEEWSILTPESELGLGLKGPRDKTSPQRLSVRELQADYQEARKNPNLVPTKDERWKKNEMERTKKERREEMLLQGKEHVSELKPWHCVVCKTQQIASTHVTCPTCGAVPTIIPRSKEENLDFLKERREALLVLKKRVPAGSGKSHLYLICIGHHVSEYVSDAMYQCVSAYFYGQQVHLLSPLTMNHSTMLYTGENLSDVVLPFVEDPIAVKKRKNQLKKMKKNRLLAGKTSKLSVAEEERQMDAGIVLAALENKLKCEWHGADNAYMLIGLTMRDLCDPDGCTERIGVIERLDRKIDGEKLFFFFSFFFFFFFFFFLFFFPSLLFFVEI